MWGRQVLVRCVQIWLKQCGQPTQAEIESNEGVMAGSAQLEAQFRALGGLALIQEAIGG